MDWYYRDGEQQFGPINEEAVSGLVSAGRITMTTLVWRDGMENWAEASASDLKTHFVTQQPRPSAPPPLPKAGSTATAIVSASQRHVKTVIADLRQMNWKAEVLPIDATNISLLKKNGAFWWMTLLGVVPLLIVTVENSNTQLTAFALFFAAVWGFLFKKFILKGNTRWQYLIGTLFFTGIVGINLLLWLYRHVFPSWYLSLSDSKNIIISLVGYVFQVGVCEELCKALPVIVILFWKRRDVTPVDLIAVGVFSGLGFAAFENVTYGQRSVLSSYSLTRAYGAAGLIAGVSNAMVAAMLRSLSLVFCHAVWAGTFTYFVFVAASTRKRWGALFVVGLAVSSILHGTYDWFASVQPTVAALLAGLSFVLFSGYLSKAQALTVQSHQNDVKAPQ